MVIHKPKVAKLGHFTVIMYIMYIVMSCNYIDYVINYSNAVSILLPQQLNNFSCSWVIFVYLSSTPHIFISGVSAATAPDDKADAEVVLKCDVSFSLRCSPNLLFVIEYMMGLPETIICHWGYLKQLFVTGVTWNNWILENNYTSHINNCRAKWSCT